jgi:hypothetical protein
MGRHSPGLDRRPYDPRVLIERFVPAPDALERHEVLVHADTETTYRQIRTLNLARSGVVRSLFFLRGIPGMLRRKGHSEAEISYSTAHLGVDDLIRFGFVVLAEEPGVEIVLGAIGRFWRLRGDVLRIRPEEFESFDRPGYAKGVMNIRAEPARAGWTRVITETRVRCTDPSSRRALLRYWRVIGPFSALIRRRFLEMAKESAERAVEGRAGQSDG